MAYKFYFIFIKVPVPVAVPIGGVGAVAKIRKLVDFSNDLTIFACKMVRSGPKRTSFGPETLIYDPH